MIDEKCFEKEWLEDFRKEKDHKAIQTNILEKMIYALHLLEQLKIHGLEFVFKGGTSLVLLLEEGNRFSIDIDIICNMDKGDLEKILEKVIQKSRFSKVELDENRSYKGSIPKAHYMFEFESVHNSKFKPSILLDVLIEDSIYPELVDCPIQTKWIHSDEPTLVKVPSIDSITGDKLTAFAPNTIGIPYFKGKHSSAMEICKQLFDLSKLFERISNMDVVATSFNAYAEQEIGYRSESRLTPDGALQDTIDTCLTITRRGVRVDAKEKANFERLLEGIKSFGSGYLMKGKFRLDDAIVAAARVAHLAAKLKVQDHSPIEVHDKQSIDTLSIEDQKWNFLNRLKKQPDKSSFYYWYNTVKLLSK
jgi:predicted nucleotidyltransferase component of viral defense system